MTTSSQFSCGDNDKGQLRSEVKDAVFHFQLARFPETRPVLKISCGWDFTLALLETGEVFGWGSNSYGQLGWETVKAVCHPRRLCVASAIDIACGLRHSAVVAKNGSVFSAGFNKNFQLGFETCGKHLAAFCEGKFKYY